MNEIKNKQGKAKKGGKVVTVLASSALMLSASLGLMACEKKKPTLSDVYITGEYQNVKEFVLGQNVSLAGVTVEVSYSDGSIKTITIDDTMWDRSSVNLNTVGEKQITVRFTVDGVEHSEIITIRIIYPSEIQSFVDSISGLPSLENADYSYESLMDDYWTQYNALSAPLKALLPIDYLESFTKAVKVKVFEQYKIWMAESTEYTEDSVVELNNIIDQAIADLNNASSIENMMSITQTAKTALDAIETKLETAQKDALSFVDNLVATKFDEDLYTEEKWEELLSVVDEIKESIQNINYVEELEHYLNEEYYEYMSLDRVDTILSTQIEETITNLPTVDNITLDDQELVTSAREAYNALSEENKERIDNYSQLQELETRLFELDAIEYMNGKIASLQNLVVEADYDSDHWNGYNADGQEIPGVLDYIEEAITWLNDLTKTDGAVKSYIDMYYNEYSQKIYAVPTKAIINLENQLLKLPYYYKITSMDPVIQNNEQSHVLRTTVQIIDNTFTIDETTYTINGTDILQDTVKVATIENDAFVLNDVAYTITTNLAETVETVRELYDTVLVGDIADRFNSYIDESNLEALEDRLEKIAYLDQEYGKLLAYKNIEDYSEDGWAQIISYASNVKNCSFDGTLESFATGIEQLSITAKIQIDAVDTLLIETKRTVETILTEYHEATRYFPNELTQIKTIIFEAKRSAYAIETSETLTTAQAVAQIETIINNAKVSINALDTAEKVFKTALQTYLTSFRDYIDLSYYTGVTEEDLTNPDTDKELAIAYQEAINEYLNEDLLMYCADDYILYLNNKLENAKSKIDKIPYQRVITIESQIEDAMKAYEQSQDINDLYIFIGKSRLPYGSNTSYFVLNDDSEKHLIRKIENNQLYIFAPYLTMLTESEVTNNEDSTYSLELHTTDGGMSADNYTVIIDTLFASTNNVTQFTTWRNAGSGSEASGSGSEWTLTSYDRGTEVLLGLESVTTGNTIVSFWDAENHCYRFYVKNFTSSDSTVVIRPNLDGSIGLPLGDTKRTYEISICNPAGNTTFKFIYNEKTELASLQAYYVAELQSYDIENQSKYSEGDWTAIQNYISGKVTEINAATTSDSVSTIYEEAYAYLQSTYSWNVTIDRSTLDARVQEFVYNYLQDVSSFENFDTYSRFIEIGEIKVKTGTDDIFKNITNDTQFSLDTYYRYSVQTDDEFKYKSFEYSNIKYKFLEKDGKLWMDVGAYLEFAGRSFTLTYGNTIFTIPVNTVVESTITNTSVEYVNQYFDASIENENGVLNITTEHYDTKYALTLSELQESTSYVALAVIQVGDYKYITSQSMAENYLLSAFSYAYKDRVVSEAEASHAYTLYMISEGEQKDVVTTNFTANYKFESKQNYADFTVSYHNTYFAKGDTFNPYELEIVAKDFDGNEYYLSADDCYIDYGSYGSLEEFNQALLSGGYRSYYVGVSCKHTSNYASFRINVMIDAPTLQINDTIVSSTYDERYNMLCYEYEVESPGTIKLSLNDTPEDYVLTYTLSGAELKVNFPFEFYFDGLDTVKYFDVREIDEFGEYKDGSVVEVIRVNISQLKGVTGISLNGTEATKQGSDFYLNIDRMEEVNQLTIEATEGVEYRVFSSFEQKYITDFNDIKLGLGGNFFSISIGDPTNNDRVQLYIIVAGDVYNTITFDHVYLSESVNLYDEVNNIEKGLIDVAYPEIDGLTSLTITNKDGNSILSNNQIDMTGMEYLPAILNVVIDGITYRYDFVLTNFSRKNNESDLATRLEFVYNTKDCSPTSSSSSSGGGDDIMYATHVYELELPKNFSFDKLELLIDEEYEGEATAKIVQLGTRTDVAKVVITNSDQSTCVVYLDIIQLDFEENSSVKATIGGITTQDLMENMNANKEDYLDALESITIDATATTVEESNPYYSANIDEYYSADLTLKTGQLFVILTEDDFQIVTLQSDLLVPAMDEGRMNFYQVGNFNTGEIVVFDITSSNGQKTARYMITLEKEAVEPDFTLSVSKNDEFIVSGIYNEEAGGADFMVGLNNAYYLVAGTEAGVAVGDTVTLTFTNTNQTLFENAVITLTGEYNKDDTSSYAEITEDLTLQTQVIYNDYMEMPIATFAIHQIDADTKEQVGEPILFAIMFGDFS